LIYIVLVKKIKDHNLIMPFTPISVIVAKNAKV